MGSAADYEWGEIIGEGNHARIYRVIRHADGQAFAAKVRFHAPHHDALHHHPLLRAVEPGHPHLSWLVDAFLHDGTSVTILPFRLGRSLQSLIAESGPLDPELIGHITGQLVASVVYVHRRGLQLGDLKVRDILVDAGHVFILDCHSVPAPVSLAEQGNDWIALGVLIDLMETGYPTRAAQIAARGVRVVMAQSAADHWQAQNLSRPGTKRSVH